jgi:PAS domain S-box-containing protein
MLPDNSSADLYQLLVDCAPEMLSQHKPDGKYSYVSLASQVLTGYDPKELANTVLYEHVHINDVEKIRKAWSLVRMQQHEQSVEYRFRHKDGRYIWLKTTYKTLNKYTPDMLAYTQSIEDAKALESALQILADHDRLLPAEDWFHVLTSHLTNALKVSFAFITELNADGEHVRMLSFWKGKDFATPYSYPLEKTPCDDVIRQGKICYYAIGVQRMFPDDADLVALNAQGYLGLPVYSIDRRVIGHVAILDNKPLKISDVQLWLAKLFASRVGIELERYHRELIN